MEISKSLAQEIVENLKDVIDKDINLMNSEGYIIASTDPSRINTFHEASKKCIENNSIIVISSDDEYIGSRSGINLPIEFDKSVVGVIGISGEKEEVEKYGTIIKQMTEILLKEQRIKTYQAIERENKRNLIESLIYNKELTPNLIPSGLDFGEKYLAYSQIYSNKLDFSKREYVLKYIESVFQTHNPTAAFIHNELIIIFKGKDEEEVFGLLEKVISHMKNNYDLDISFGISETFTSLSNVNNYYNQAIRAYKWKKFYDEKNIIFYDEMALGLLVTAIDEKELYQFSYKILKNIDNDQLSFYRDLIFFYGKYNGSINKIADAMFMHKNSIQYRLDKLYKLTGYNPRNVNDYIILWFAFISLD